LPPLPGAIPEPPPPPPATTSGVVPVLTADAPPPPPSTTGSGGAMISPFAGGFLGREAAADDRFLAWWRRYSRSATSPGTWAVMQPMLLEVDVRDVLSTIRVPTLVIHRRDDPWIRVGHGRFLAEHIPDATYVELDGSEHQFFLGDTGALLHEIERFIGGSRPRLDIDRVLATVLFTDIVESTQAAAKVGDREWHNLLDTHDEIVRRELDRFQGHRVRMTGDGVIATFDGPARAIRCASSIVDQLRPLGIHIRCGLHTGEIELRGDDIGGIGVHIAARIRALAQADEILVSSTVKDLVAGSGVSFTSRGSHALKGVPDEWQLFAVEGV
jgi:class 3 adenylate cyclase